MGYCVFLDSAVDIPYSELQIDISDRQQSWLIRNLLVGKVSRPRWVYEGAIRCEIALCGSMLGSQSRKEEETC